MEFRRVLLLFAIVFFSCCKMNKEKQVKFSNDINRYNYLDKPHDLKYVYDFQSAFSSIDSLKLIDRLKRINDNDSIAFIVVFNQYKGKVSFKESTIRANEIFTNKYDLDKVINFNIDKYSKRMSIGYSRSLSKKVNDSICNVIMERDLKPNFKKNEFYLGIDKSVNSFLEYINN